MVSGRFTFVKCNTRHVPFLCTFLFEFYRQQQVLRCYDHRVRKTDRSPDVYLSRTCKGIVGNVEQHPMVKLRFGRPVPDDGNESDKFQHFWENSTVEFEDYKNFRKEKGEFWFNATDHTLLPYRHGDHLAKKANAFVPIIDLLQELHNQGFVHGDIRAFNTCVWKEGRQ
eukprot:scaffold14565_cov91-Cylindrotheca_fusiformis.AAC.2